MTKEQRQNKILILIVAILLLANIATLIIHFTHREAGRKQTGRKSTMENFLRKEVGYDDSQIKQFDALYSAHTKNMDSIFATMKKEKEARFNYLASQHFSDSALQAAASSMSQLQKEAEL